MLRWGERGGMEARRGQVREFSGAVEGEREKRREWGRGESGGCSTRLLILGVSQKAQPLQSPPTSPSSAPGPLPYLVLQFEREATAAAASATVVANAVGNSRRQEEKEQLAEAVVQLQGEREALERSLAAERRSAKASAASKAAMEIEMANNEARLRRSAEDLSRLRAEAEAAQAEVAQLRAEKDMLAGAKRGLEEVTAREKADLMKALADLEELSARLVAAQEAAEVSEGARRRLEEELRDGKAVGRRAAEQVRSVASERNALAAVHADIGTDLLAVLQMLQVGPLLPLSPPLLLSLPNPSLTLPSPSPHFICIMLPPASAVLLALDPCTSSALLLP